METTVYWLTSVAALGGVWLNIHRRVECFYVWACTNAVWVYADAKHDLMAQAALQATYFILSIYGIYEWRRGKHHGREANRTLHTKRRF